MEREDNSRGRFIFNRAVGLPPMISSHELSFVLGELLFLGANQVSQRKRRKNKREEGGKGTYQYRAFVSRL